MRRKGTALEDWATRLGLGHTTGIDVPGEAAGRVPTPAWRRQYFKTRGRQDLEAGQLDQPGDRPGRPASRTPCRWRSPTRRSPTAATSSPRTSGVKIVAPDGTLVRRLESAPPKKLEHLARRPGRRTAGLARGGVVGRRHLDGGLRRLPDPGGRQDRHGAGVRQARLRLVCELCAGQRPQVRRRRHDRAGWSRRHRRPRRPRA